MPLTNPTVFWAHNSYHSIFGMKGSNYKFMSWNFMSNELRLVFRWKNSIVYRNVSQLNGKLKYYYINGIWLIAILRVVKS